MLLFAASWLSVAAATVEIPHERFTLDNGMEVILHRDPSLPQVVVNTWYGVGSKDEVAGRSGFAHLFEHLMFMGTERLPDSGFDDLMEAHGGWNNAWTSEDATDYYDVGPTNLLPLLLWMEADRMDGLDVAMTQEKLDLQRKVVRNERRQSMEDAPYGIAWLEMPRMLYPVGHPYAHSVIGSHEDLEAATVEDVNGFFATWYVPNNASLVVAGDFDPAALRPLIERTFGGLEGRPLPTRATPPQPDKPITAVLELEDQVQLPKTILLWHTAPALKPGDAEMDFVSAILAHGRSSRLYRRLVVEDAIALEVDAYQMSQMLGSVFMIDVIPAEGHTLEEVESAVREELDRLAAEGPDEAEMERVLNNLEISFLRGLEDLHSRAMALNRYRYLTGDPAWVDDDLARYRAVDVAGVKTAAALLSAPRQGTMRIRPEATPAPTDPGEGAEQ